MSNTRKPKLADVRSKATPARVIVPICVAGELIAEHARLDRRLEKLQDDELRGRESKKLSGPTTEADRITKRLLQLEHQMEALTYDFEFEHLPGTGWRDLMDEHGPREGKERQERWNPNTFPPAAVQACCVSPEGMDDDEQFRAFWDGDINDGQRDELFRGALNANEAALSIPFSVNVSAHQSTSDESSTTASPTPSHARSS